MNDQQPAEQPAQDGPLAALDRAVDSATKKVTPTAKRGSGLEVSLVTFASSLAAVVVAFLIGGVLLLLTGRNPLDAYSKILEIGLTQDKLLESLQRATPLMIAACAVAVGFKMNLFNIGVEGQFLTGMFWAAVAGAYVELPAVLHVTFCILVGIAAGAVWASFAALLKVRRGVNEVISTIMLNAIALSLIQWLFDERFRFDDGSGALDVRTKQLPTSAWTPDWFDGRLNSFIAIALLVVFVYWVLVFKTRFGFRLRASGMNAGAAQVAGIGAKRMIVTAMLISGGIAGIAGLPALLGDTHSYGPTRPDGYGFNGIAVALLGRNHPIGIVLAAVLWGFLDSVTGPLQLADIPQSIVKVIQGITLLSVVIINEAVSRWWNRRTAERAAKALELTEATA